MRRRTARYALPTPPRLPAHRASCAVSVGSRARALCAAQRKFLLRRRRGGQDAPPQVRRVPADRRALVFRLRDSELLGNSAAERAAEHGAEHATSSNSKYRQRLANVDGELGVKLCRFIAT